MGKSSSSSQANQASTTTNNDGRIINGEGGIVAQDSSLSLDSSTSNNWLTNYNTSSNFDARVDDSSTKTTITNTTTADPEIAKAAFDFASGANATNGQGFDKLLSVAAELTKNTQDNATSLANRFSDGLAQAFDSGKNTTPGGIDTKP